MDSELELVKAQVDKLRWMITQLDNSCDGTPVMISYILSKKEQLKDKMEKISSMDKTSHPG